MLLPTSLLPRSVASSTTRSPEVPVFTGRKYSLTGAGPSCPMEHGSQWRRFDVDAIAFFFFFFLSTFCFEKQSFFFFLFFFAT